MALSPEQKARRAAQRKLARQLKRGESPLGGEFRKYVERAIGRPITPETTSLPSPPPPTEELDYESILADAFANSVGIGAGPDQQIPMTYYPTATSYPSRLPQNRHPRTKAAGYNRLTQTLAVRFWTPENLYYYYKVTPAIAREFRLAESPGDYINDVLNGHPYQRII